MSSNLKVNTILPSTGTTVTVSGIASVTSSISAGSSITATTFYGSGANLTGITQTTINNNADNRVITGSGTANTLNGESGVTIDGSNILSVLGSGQQQLNVGSTNAGGAAIVLDGDSNGDGSGGDYSLIRHNTDGDLEFYARSTGGATNTIFKQGTSERLRIDSTGITTITSSSNEELFRICTSFGNSGGVQGKALMGFDHFSVSQKPAILIGSEEDGNASHKGHFVVKLKDAAATDDDPVERLRILSNGHVAIGDDIANDTGMFKVIAADGQSDDQYVGQFKNLEATANRNWGLLIQAGSSGTDESLRVRNAANNADHLTVTGNGHVTMPSQPTFAGRMYAGQGSSPQTGLTAWTFSTIELNQGSHFNNTTGYFTCPVAGRYAVMGTFNRRSGNSVWSGFYIVKNGITVSENWHVPGNANEWSPISTQLILNCSANDIIAACYHNSYAAPATSNFANNIAIWLLG